MPKAKPTAKSSRTAKSAAKSKAVLIRKSKPAALTGEVVFLNIGVSKQARAGLNKLVLVLKVANQRGVLEQLIAAELHRHNLRLPRAA
jgi:hypothetical protein